MEIRSMRVRSPYAGLFAAVALLSACGGGGGGGNDPSPTPEPSWGELVFQTGYENNVGSPLDAHQSISGADQSFTEKNDWEQNLVGHPNIDDAWIFYEGGTAAQRYAKIITDPADPANKVLHYWLGEAYIPYGTNKLKGRIQATIDANSLYEFKMKHKLFLPEDMRTLTTTSESFRWLTIQEFWNDPVESSYPFRISVNIIKPDSGPELRFAVAGQTKRSNEEAWDDVWRSEDTTLSIPIGEWITLETYFKEGNASTGRFSLTVTTATGEQYLVADMTNFTYHPSDPSPDGLNNFNPMKLYAPDRLISPMQQAGKALQLYWDDFELRVKAP